MHDHNHKRLYPVPTVEIELDRRRNLRYNLAAFRRAERRFSEIHGRRVNIFTFFQESAGAFSAEEIIVLIHVGLVHESPELTEDAVADMLHPGMMNYLGEKLNEALGQKMEETGGEPRPLARSPG